LSIRPNQSTFCAGSLHPETPDLSDTEAPPFTGSRYAVKAGTRSSARHATDLARKQSATSERMERGDIEGDCRWLRSGSDSIGRKADFYQIGYLGRKVPAALASQAQPIPTGLNHPAQGCEEQATLGTRPQICLNPEIRFDVSGWRCSQGSRFAATVGWMIERRWRSRLHLRRLHRAASCRTKGPHFPCRVLHSKIHTLGLGPASTGRTP